MDDGASLLQDSTFVKILMDALPCGFVVLNEDGRVQMMNDTMARALGTTGQTVIGKRQGEVLSCLHTFESSADCGCTSNCSLCDIRTLSYSVLADNQEKKRKASVQLLINGQLRNLTLMLNAIPLTFATRRFVLLLIEDIHKLFHLPSTHHKKGFRGIIGRDKSMLELFETIKQVAPTNASVLIQGESGTGKELVALALHKESLRANKHFIPVNCSALPENLVETELFGHVKGAFTGAICDKKGRFELAHSGTIFLDEVGELSPAIQAKLLRVLESGEIRRVGSERAIKVDVRVISATNRTLEDEVTAGRFREDLYYRLRVVPITTSPLRKRRGDISLLCEHFLMLLGKEPGFHKHSLAPEALSLLKSYSWPGNVRELQNVLYYSMIKAQGEFIEVEDLPIISPQLPLLSPQESKLREEDVISALQQAKGNKSRAAEILRVSRSTLYRFFDKQKQTARMG